MGKYILDTLKFILAKWSNYIINHLSKYNNKFVTFIYFMIFYSHNNFEFFIYFIFLYLFYWLVYKHFLKNNTIFGDKLV